MKKNRLWDLTLNKGGLWKILLLMKTFIFLSIFCLQLNASVLLSQHTISIKMQNANLKECINLIEENSGLGFLYNGKELKEVNGITIDAQNLTVEEVLNDILLNNGYEYVIQDEVILITKAEAKPINNNQKAIKVKGKVTDADGIPLPGATILEDGTLNGVTTDSNGNFTLTVKGAESVIKVSFIGFTTQLITVGAQTIINVVLQESAENLNEVVITGYQTISKERATGSFSIVTEDDLGKKLNNNLTQMIEGLTTGLVTDYQGNITIRGISTFQTDAETKSPLIVLDGFPYNGDLNSINSDNIANITVLKDGVAASIYGSRSANGVIVVTTKKGRKGEFNVSYKGTFSITKKTNLADMNFSTTSQYIDGKIAQFNSAPFYFTHSPFSREAAVDYILADVNYGIKTMEQGLADIEQYRSIDGRALTHKYGLRNQFSQQHNISISGGSENNQFNAAINYLDHKGEELLSSNSRLIIDIKNTWAPTDFITISASANMVYQKSKNSNTSMFSLMSGGLEPYDRIVDDMGNPTEVVDYVNPAKIAIYNNYSGLKDAGYSPLDDMKLGMASTNDFQTRLSASIKVDVIKGLDVTLGGAWTRGNRNSKSEYDGSSYLTRIAYNDGTSMADPSVHYFPEGGMLDETRGFNESYTLRTQVNFYKTFSDNKHRVSVIAGNEIRKDTYNNNTMPTRLGYNATSGDFVFIDNSKLHPYYADNPFDYLGGGYYARIPWVTTGGFSLRDNRYVSWYGNGSYEYDNRFILSGSIRLDLTNFFGTDPKYRYRPIWSMGGTYKISQENWFNVPWIDRMDVRASYGINGNIAFPEGPFMILASSGFNQRSQGIAYRVQSPPNKQLRWEQTATTNFGVDLTVLKNRLSVSVDYYLKKSSDVLAPDAVDRTRGVSTLTKNAGKITNKGIEIGINGHVISTEDLNYRTNLNISYNSSMVDEYNINRAYSTYYLWDGGSGIAEPGYPMASSWGYPQAPLAADGSSQTYNANGDLIHPNNVGLDDVMYMGTLIPTTNIAWTNTFSYKNFDLSFMLVGSFGAIMWMDAFTGNNIENKYVAQAWKEPGDELTTIHPKISLWGEGWWPTRGEQHVQSADYVKLRDLTIAYNIPQKLLKQLGFKRAKVYIQGRNLLSFTASGIDNDPETRGLPLKAEFYTGVSFEF